MRARAIGAFLLSALATYGSLTGARVLRGADSPGTVEGSVLLAERLKGRAGRVVVYLETLDGKVVPLPAGAEKKRIAQKNARFDPSFLVVGAGQDIIFTNEEDEDLAHNVFSFSEPHTFDLGLFGRTAQKTETFSTPGEVAIFCSIHKLMEATVYVAPTPWFAIVDEGTGRWKIEKVPAGRWRARTWVSSKRCPNASAEVDLPGGESARVDFTLGKKG